MPKLPKYGTPDEENPEWTKEDFASAMRYPNLPLELMRIIEAEKKKRGAQKAPKKEAISIRMCWMRCGLLGRAGRLADEILRAELVAK